MVQVMTERMAIELVKFNQIIRAMGESAVGESYYIKAPHKLSVLNDALRGIKTGRPNRTNRGGLTSKKLLHHTLTAGRGMHIFF